MNMTPISDDWTQDEYRCLTCEVCGKQWDRYTGAGPGLRHCSEECAFKAATGRARTSSDTKLRIGDTKVMVAMNGHLMEYNVVGYYSDGSARTSSWDAMCTENCRACADGEPLPDW